MEDYWLKSSQRRSVMHTNIQRPIVFDSYWFRAGARTCAVVLIAVWIALVVAEAIRSRFEMPSPLTQYQGLTLAAVFAGYAIGWRNELVGGFIAILGTLAFFALNRFMAGGFPGSGAALFAVPGILYLLAWYNERKSGAFRERQL
jgi:hypothetical protein